jgi:uncharacterized coiled-coil DUF342 family protein
MNKYIIGVGILAIVIAGLLLLPGQSVDYVKVVDEQVTELEAELVDMQAKVEAGTLTVAEANTTRAKIVAKIESINASVEASGKATLTPEQKSQLLSGLARLKDILENYASSLVVVENTATIKPEIKTSRGGRSQTITAAVIETIDTVEDKVVEVVDEYTPEEETKTPSEETEMEVVQESEETASIDSESSTTTIEIDQNTEVGEGLDSVVDDSNDLAPVEVSSSSDAKEDEDNTNN